MNEFLFSITYPPIPITQIGPVAFSLHGVFAAVGFYFGSTYAIKLCVKDGNDDQLFSDAFTWAIFGATIRQVVKNHKIKTIIEYSLAFLLLTTAILIVYN